jgi:hypothetical protein
MKEENTEIRIIAISGVISKLLITTLPILKPSNRTEDISNPTIKITSKYRNPTEIRDDITNLVKKFSLIARKLIRGEAINKPKESITNVAM